MTASTSGRWNDPDRVEEFARRDPDHRLSGLVKEFDSPATIRVLDLGCAGGRNTVFLLDKGFDVEALDAAPAMVERTRTDLVRASGDPRAADRVRVGGMDVLDFADDDRYGLIVALGIYHLARDEAELDRAIAESSRVLAPEGRVLVAMFAPGTRLKGREFVSVPGTRYVHEREPEDSTTSAGGSSGNTAPAGADAGDDYRVCLLTPDELDREMARHGLVPVVPTEQVVRDVDDSHRAVTNGLFVKK